MTKKDSHTHEEGARKSHSSASRHSADSLQALTHLAHELGVATNIEEAIHAALRTLYVIVTADALYLTSSAGEGRQTLRARLERGEEFENLTDGEAFRVQHTMLARALESAVPLCFNNMSQELVGEALIGSLLCQGAQSAVCAPLKLGAGATGVIIVSAHRAAAYNKEDECAVELVAHLLSAAITRIEQSEPSGDARRHAKARQHADVLMETLAAEARAGLDADHIIERAVETLFATLPASFIVMRTLNQGRPEQTLHAWTTGAQDHPLEIHAPPARLERPVYSEQRPVFVEDLRMERAAHKDLTPFVERLGARSLYLAPVAYGGQVIAALGLVESDKKRRWTHAEQSLVARAGEIIAPILLNAQLNNRLQSLVEDLSTLLALAFDVSNEADADRALLSALDTWSKIAGTDSAAILRWDEEASLLRLAASKHLPTGILERYTRGITLDDPVCGLAATKRISVAADLAGEARFAELFAAARWAGLRGAWATPLLGPRSKLLGVLVTFSRSVREIKTDEQRLADLFARTTALVLQNLEWNRAARSAALSVKQLEENLRKSEQHRTEVLAVISHELRTPLNAIIGYAQMLREGFSGELNAQQSSDVETIIESADKLLRMVEDILDLARIDAERFPIYMDSLSYDDVIRRAVAGVRSTAEVKGLKIKHKISEDTPQVRTDPERVRQILTNLLSNAVKFTDAGTVEISVEPYEAGSVQFTVVDTGIGFDTNAFPHIFEEFRQADASNTRAYSGTGLGLAVSKRLIQRLGGNIGVSSTPGEGSTFWFRLPPEIPGADS